MSELHVGDVVAVRDTVTWISGDWVSTYSGDEYHRSLIAPWPDAERMAQLESVARAVEDVIAGHEVEGEHVRVDRGAMLALVDAYAALNENP